MDNNTPACQRQSVSRPLSYKEFAETGNKEAILDGPEVNQQVLMNANNSEESRDSSTGEISYADTDDSNELQEVETNATYNSQSSIDEEIQLCNPTQFTTGSATSPHNSDSSALAANQDLAQLS